MDSLGRSRVEVSVPLAVKFVPFTLPDPLTMADGQGVFTPDQWNARRRGILRFYQEQIYGQIRENALRELNVTLHLPKDATQPVPVLVNLSFQRRPARAPSA